MKIAISGHRGLPADTERLVEQALRSHLHQLTNTHVTGISCLADGADQLFARAVLDLGGTLEVIIPAEQYRDGLPDSTHAAYDDLLGNAATVHRLESIESTSESHMAASRMMLDHADQLGAVWDGQPARGYGGTADVVAEAHRHNLPVTVVWPVGVRRD